MCRWLAYQGIPIRLEEALYAPENSLVEQSIHAAKAKIPVNGDGFGVGWYSGRDRPGVYREVLPAWRDDNLRSIAAHIESGLFLAHVRAATHGETSRFNCHPFNHDRWLFLHNGRIGAYESLRWQLDRLIPESFYGVRRGTTDSELIFCLLLASGLEDDPEQALRVTLARIIGRMQDLGTCEPLRFTSAFSDGERLFAVRYSTDARPPTLFWKQTDDYVLIASEPLDNGDSPTRERTRWRAVPPNHLLCVHEGRTDLTFFRPQPQEVV